MYNGDFSFGGQGLPIYNPNTMRQDATGKWVSDPFPNNQIPLSMFDPVARNFLAHNPFVQANKPGIMTQTGPQQNLIVIPPKYVHRWISDFKIDHQFSAKQKSFGCYSHETEPVWYSATFNAQFAWTAIDPSQQPLPTSLYNAVFSDTYIFGPSALSKTYPPILSRTDPAILI